MPPPTMTTSRALIGRAAASDRTHSLARTRSSSVEMNSGDVFSDSVRRSVVANSRARLRRLHVDVEEDFRCDRRRSRSGRPEKPARVDANDRR